MRILAIADEPSPRLWGDLCRSALSGMDLILSVGANSIRLAHYQHDQYFYDLCDEKGMVVWAEIPYITVHMEGGRENCLPGRPYEQKAQSPGQPGCAGHGARRIPVCL